MEASGKNGTAHDLMTNVAIIADRAAAGWRDIQRRQENTLCKQNTN
ncbi:MAG: hypothetical protein MI924_24890 [Chloroflexales bacterium]|nr:hypothetical protein [Chloroflexales bacterium]